MCDNNWLQLAPVVHLASRLDTCRRSGVRCVHDQLSRDVSVHSQRLQVEDHRGREQAAAGQDTQVQA